jgi:hypothetical protein
MQNILCDGFLLVHPTQFNSSEGGGLIVIPHLILYNLEISEVIMET